MPFFERVEERYRCPGLLPWTWLDKCTRTTNRWCYYFNYYKSNAWGFWRTVTACESGFQYSWTEPGFHFKSFVHRDTESVGGGPYKECFPERKATSGTCTENVATGSAQLTPSSEPFIGRATVAIKELSRETTERGTTVFTPESSNRCRQGTWPWQRVQHSQEIAIAVKFGHVDVSWTLDGFLLAPGGGTVQTPTFSSWPDPAPSKPSTSAGSSSTLAVGRHFVLPNLATVTYTIDNSISGLSVLRLSNRPSDGNFDFEVGLVAKLKEVRYHAESIDCHFSGESVAFEARLLEQEMRCLVERYEVEREPPRPGGPVMDIGYVRQAIPEERHGVVSSLLALMEGVLGRDPEASTILLDRLSEEIGATGVLRALGGRAQMALRKRLSTNCDCHAR